MIGPKLIVVGQVIRQVGNKVIVRNGETIETYNLNYYRVIER
jgi:hypothetical protein